MVGACEKCLFGSKKWIAGTDIIYGSINYREGSRTGAELLPSKSQSGEWREAEDGAGRLRRQEREEGGEAGGNGMKRIVGWSKKKRKKRNKGEKSDVGQEKENQRATEEV